VRKASGLVREVSGFDVLAYNMFMISIGYTLFIVLYWISYPGASLELAIVITTFVSVFQGLTYALLATVYPRSGGDYVYITRIIHPTLGFVMSWNFFVWMLFYLGLNAGMLGFQGLAPMLAGIGFVTNQPNLISAAQWAGTPSAYFMIGIVSIVFYGILLASGMKNYFTFQKIVFVIALASAVVTIVLLGNNQPRDIHYTVQYFLETILQLGRHVSCDYYDRNSERLRSQLPILTDGICLVFRMALAGDWFLHDICFLLW
jgi:amino acid transporter